MTRTPAPHDTVSALGAPMTDRRRLGILLALATAATSGVAVFLNARAVAAFGNPTAFTTAKNLVSAVLLLAAFVGLASSRGAVLTRPTGVRQWATLAMVGVIGGSVPFVLFFEGLSRATSPQAAFLHKTLVLWVALLAVAFLGERLQWGHWLAIGLLLTGQVGLAGGAPGGIGGAELLILAATLLWSVEVVVAKRLLGGLSSWTVALARMGLGSVVLVAWTASRGDLAFITGMTREQLGWVLLTGALLATYVATWFAALQRAQAVDVTAVLVLAAPLTAVLSRIADGTALPVGWVALLCVGGALAAWLGSRRADPVPVVLRA